MATVSIDATAPKKIATDVDADPARPANHRREYEVRQQTDGKWHWHAMDVQNRKITLRGQAHPTPEKCERAIRQELKAVYSPIDPVITVFPPLKPEELTAAPAKRAPATKKLTQQAGLSGKLAPVKAAVKRPTKASVSAAARKAATKKTK